MQKRILLIIWLTVITLFSCKRDFLDKGPDQNLTIDQVFSQRRYAESFLTSIYGLLPRNLYYADLTQVNPFIVGSDEMDTPWPGEFAKMLNRGAWNPDNIPVQAWKGMYEGIRKANIFLENVDKVPMGAADKQRWIGEATFLRAFYHFFLMRIHGPVPILDRALGAEEDYSNIRRRSLDTCVNFVATECDKAAALLPMTVTADKYGRVIKPAALALKAVVLLHAASPLWNGNPDYAGFTDNQGVQLFPAAYRKEKWEQAAAAAKACIEECEGGGYRLYRSAGNDPIKNYQELFLKNWNSEVLFAYNYGVEGWIEKCSFPRGMSGWSGWSPTQEQVDEYEMDNGTRPITGYNADGSPVIDPASGYREDGYTTEAQAGRWLAGVRNMYVRREPRFYASIHFNGSHWISRQLEFWISGLDGKVGGGYSTTGYLLKKFADPNVNLAQGRFVQKTGIYFRLGELYLDYAEALNEAQGPVSDVYEYVNQIRDRAGLPPLPAGLSQEGMRARIRHERRVELAFETLRYFDCHRWKIAYLTDNREIHGMNISTGTGLQDNSFYKRTVVEKRVFTAPKHYLFPLPQSEINKNRNFAQNPGW